MQKITPTWKNLYDYCKAHNWSEIKTENMTITKLVKPSADTIQCDVKGIDSNDSMTFTLSFEPVTVSDIRVGYDVQIRFIINPNITALTTHKLNSCIKDMSGPSQLMVACFESDGKALMDKFDRIINTFCQEINPILYSWVLKQESADNNNTDQQIHSNSDKITDEFRKDAYRRLAERKAMLKNLE